MSGADLMRCDYHMVVGSFMMIGACTFGLAATVRLVGAVASPPRRLEMRFVTDPMIVLMSIPTVLGFALVLMADRSLPACGLTGIADFCVRAFFVVLVSALAGVLFAAAIIASPLPDRIEDALGQEALKPRKPLGEVDFSKSLTIWGEHTPIETTKTLVRLIRNGLA